MELNALLINCTLKKSHGQSSTAKLLGEVGDALREHDVKSDSVRIADLNIMPGVSANEGPGDDWPAVRRQILDADIVIVGTPIWMGHLCSHAQRVCERLDAFLDEKDDRGRTPLYGKVLACAIVGNEDGAHAVTAALFQGLNDVGFTIPAMAVTYWVGEAMGDKNYVDLDHTPRHVSSATKMLAANAVHLARGLKASAYPGRG
jgi:multimeric flavodoxin WrbA